MWTKAQTAAHQRALATAERLDERIAKLEKLAQFAPAFAERIRDLRLMRDNLEQLARTAISIDAEGE